MEIIPASYIAAPGEHAVMTGVITGSVTTQDGTTYDVNDGFIAVPPEHAEEVAHLISARYEAEGHPSDPDYVYDTPKAFAKYEAHEANTTLSKES